QKTENRKQKTENRKQKTENRKHENMKSYKDLEIYNLSLSLFYKTHAVSLKLPKYELYELGSQIRRSSDSVVTNIVEGYGRKRYKMDFIKFLTYSHASNLETICHIEKLIVLYPDLSIEMIVLQKEYDILGAKLFSFLCYVENNWNKFE
ncbi:MAG: four helix bundle protein, partial [Flavobacterium sp.]